MSKLRQVISDRPLFYHHLEWMLMHPRFGILMLGLIAASFSHNQLLAAILFVVFVIELGLRVAIMRNKIKTNPYRSSLNRKLDSLFLVLDFIGVASLLITVLNIPLDASDAALARMLRAVYLMRTLRAFRYIDLPSAMYSPTYGMFISFVIMMSFFAQDTLMWVIIIFFLVELAIRFIIMRHMEFETRKEKASEWIYWWIDMIATIVMIPAFAVIPYGSSLRMLRLIRLLRPWMVIIRNLKEVMREGQFMQEINLIILLLGALSIGGGVIGHLTFDNFDYNQNGTDDPRDHTILATIWFAFRLFTDPGNTVAYPETTAIAIFSVMAVVIGVFIFAFFIGIGASIVSGLMGKLRNERLNVTNHMVMLGWSSVAPYILDQLRTISERHYSKLKLVLLNDKEETPEDLLDYPWVSYRWGDMEDIQSLRRINLKHARQAIVNIPDDGKLSDQLAHSMFTLLAIRRVNPNIYVNYNTPGLQHPQLDTHKHVLQIGWDNQGFYNKPTVVMSQAEVRANLFRNILVYRDFDQVMGRLMIPERTEESAMQVAGWDAELVCENGELLLTTPDGKHRMEIKALAAALVTRGVTLVSLANREGQSFPLYNLAEHAPMKVHSVLALAIDSTAVIGELLYVIRQVGEYATPQAESLEELSLSVVEQSGHLNLVITGWVGSLPLLLKRLLDDFETIHVRVIDDLNKQEHAEQQEYLERRVAELPGAGNRVSTEFHRWNFSDMNKLRTLVKGADRILLSRPVNMHGPAFASIATVLSHLVTIVHESGEHPDIFPVLENRDQALLLQEELQRFNLPHEVHVVVPEEFYGTYIAHTSYHMYSSESAEAYELQRTLRHVIDDLMGDVGSDKDQMDMQALAVNGVLEEDPAALYAKLLSQGHIWIGYRLQDGFFWTDPVQETIRRFFPREADFRNLRQYQIILNPFGNPVSRYSWLEHRDAIVELIVISASLEE